MDPVILLEIGEELKKQRLSLKQSVTQVSKKLKIRKAYIESIEAGKVSSLPSSAYTIGYVKEYAKYLGLDYKAYIQKLQPPKTWDDKLKSGASTNLITDKEFLPSIYIVIACVIITFLLYILFYLLKN